MSTVPAPQPVATVPSSPEEIRARLSWPWVAAGVAQGSVLLLGLLPVYALNQRADVVVVFGAFAFLLTGALLGYRSRGGTLTEAAVGGAVVVVVGLASLRLPPGYAVPLGVQAGGAVAGLLLALGGGWVGLRLRAGVSSRAPDDRSVSWPWVAVGVTLGVMLNGSAVFVVSGLAEAVGIEWSGATLAVTFLGSFLATGLFVGYHAPGHTPKDSALVAVGVVAVDALLLEVVFQGFFPGIAVVGGGLVGLFLVLAGGWAGDRAWQLVHGRRPAERGAS